MRRMYLLVVFLLSVFIGFSQDAAEKINQAQEALKAQDYAKAYQLYDEAMSNLGDVQVDESINFNIGFAAYKADNLEGAVKYLDKAIETGTNVSKCYEYKALAYNDKKDYANAVANFEKAIETATEGAESLVFNAAISAYKGSLLDKAVTLFGKAVELGYKGETASYYKAVVFKKLGKDDEYKAALIEGAEKFPTEDKITSALASIYVSEGNDLYKAGVAIINAANEKVNGGSLTTTDAAYTAEIDKSKEKFKAALEILEKAKALDAGNDNAAKLIDACKAVL